MSTVVGQSESSAIPIPLRSTCIDSPRNVKPTSRASIHHEKTANVVNRCGAFGVKHLRQHLPLLSRQGLNECIKTLLGRCLREDALLDDKLCCCNAAHEIDAGTAGTSMPSPAEIYLSLMFDRYTISAVVKAIRRFQHLDGSLAKWRCYDNYSVTLMVRFNKCGVGEENQTLTCSLTDSGFSA